MVIFGVAFIAFGWHFLYEMVGPVLTFGIGSFFIIRGSIACEMQGSECFNYSFLRHLGDASYSIYLTHYPLSSMLAKAIKKTGFHQAIPVDLIPYLIVFTVISAGFLFHFQIERPLLKFFHPKGD